MNSKEDHTLDIITKFDRLSADSESEKAFLELTRKEDIFFKLDWHVLKNRTYEEDSSSFEERNLSESRYFWKSNFATLFKDCVGIDSLRNRLSQLLFNHVKQKLSKLRKNLEKALTDSRDQLKTMNDQRVTSTECRIFLMQLSLNFYEVGKAAVNEHYEEDYFTHNIDSTFSLQSLATIRRLRIVIQYMNSHFFNSLRTRGHKYHIDRSERSDSKEAEITITDVIFTLADSEHEASTKLSKPEALKWIEQVLMRIRDRELSGNFNSLLIDELFWEQSSKWRQLTENHVKNVAQVCSRFLHALLREKCSKDVYTRLWSFKIEDALKLRFENSAKEMRRIMEDIRSYSITYNHYYTDTISKRRCEREQKSRFDCIENVTRHMRLSEWRSNSISAKVNARQAMQEYFDKIDSNMKNRSCEETLDSLYSIYKISISLAFLIDHL